MLLSNMVIYAQQSFYDMLRIAVDSCYNKSIDIEKQRQGYEVLVDDSYFPFGYDNSRTRRLQSRGKYKKKTLYVSGYNAILRKDTIILTVARKTFFESPCCKSNLHKSPIDKSYQSRLYRRIDHYTNPSLKLGACNNMLYVYNAEGKWKKKDISKRLFICIYDDNWLKNSVDLQDCINFALNESINREIVFGLDIFRILVLDNTFGSDFFANKYSVKRAFPYLVASEQNLKIRELKKFYNIFGWCEIFLTDNHFTIALRNVDGRKYGGKDMERATICKYIYNFAYSDTQKKWVCTKGLIVDYYHNTMTWKEY